MKKTWLSAVVLSMLLSFFVGIAAAEETVTVFAAASLTNAVGDVVKSYGDKSKDKIVTSFASSSTLAKQIENGAPANIFISADQEWMDYLAGKKMLVPESRIDLVGNRLVLIAPESSNLKVEIKPGFDLLKLLASGKLATGDPDHVPVGKYAKTALTKLGEWEKVESKIARADNVRSALALVERDECPLGIVYATDAAVSKKVKVVGIFPEDTHPPIKYPAALIAEKNSAAAVGFFDFLKSADAKVILEKYGFSVPGAAH